MTLDDIVSPSKSPPIESSLTLLGKATSVNLSDVLLPISSALILGYSLYSLFSIIHIYNLQKLLLIYVII